MLGTKRLHDHESSGGLQYFTRIIFEFCGECYVLKYDAAVPPLGHTKQNATPELKKRRNAEYENDGSKISNPYS